MSTEAAGFSLDATVRNVLADSPSTDLDELAALVFAQIPKRQHAPLLARLLRAHVRLVIGAERRGVSGAAVRPIRSGRSAKVEAVRAAWRRRLDSRVDTGEGGYKTLAACTYADLVYAADERQQAAARTLATAGEFRMMAEAVRAAGVATFGDLPIESQATILGGAA